MNLTGQLYLIFFSFLYGIFFSILMTIFYGMLHHKNKWIRIIFTFGFMLLEVSIYFMAIQRLSSGILYPYSLIFIFMGIIVETFIHQKVVIKRKK